MDEEGTNVFEQSCATFLGDMWGEAIPPIYDVECVVTGQQLLLTGRRTSLIEESAKKAAGSTDSARGGVSVGSGGGVRHRLERSLQKEEVRTLQDIGEASLLVDVNVKGKADPINSVTESSDIPFDDLVYGTFSVQSTVFVNQLKNDGSEAGIDDFDDLSTVYSIKKVNDDTNNGIENPDGSKNSGGGGESDGNEGKVNKGSIAAIAISGVVIVALFGAFFYHVGKTKSDEYDKADGSSVASEFEDVYNDSLFGIARQQQTTDNEQQQRTKHSFSIETHTPTRGVIGEADTFPSVSGGPVNAGSGTGGGSGESRNENLTYMYSLDDGLASPHSLSQPASSPGSMSLTDQLQRQMTQWIDDTSHRIRMDIVAPPGKLGIIIDTCGEGPIVHSVKPTSPLEGLMFKGDLVVAVDDEDTREWSAHYLTKLVAKKSKFERKITVLRSVVDGVPFDISQDEDTPLVV